MASRSRLESHCTAFLSENADKGVHRAAHRMEAPPLAALGEAGEVIVRRLTATLSIAGSSFDVWATLARLDLLMSDFRRISPRFSCEQISGEPGVAAGNEYRLAITDPASLVRIEDACRQLTGEPAAGALGGVRSMDLRVIRAGPWGGETGELVLETLRNHAMAGAASLWILVHGEGTDGRLPVRFDICDIARWAWAPDQLAATEGLTDRGVMDWSYFLERFAEMLDGRLQAGAPDASFSAVLAARTLGSDARLQEALRIHPAQLEHVDLLSRIS